MVEDEPVPLPLNPRTERNLPFIRESALERRFGSPSNYKQRRTYKNVLEHIRNKMFVINTYEVESIDSHSQMGMDKKYLYVWDPGICVSTLGSCSHGKYNFCLQEVADNPMTFQLKHVPAPPSILQPCVYISDDGFLSGDILNENSSVEVYFSDRPQTLRPNIPMSAWYEDAFPYPNPDSHRIDYVWPTQDVIARMCRQGCHLSHENGEPDMHFTLNFDRAEQFIVDNFTYTEGQAYNYLFTLLPIIFPDGFNARLGSKFIRHTLFWVMQELRQNTSAEIGVLDILVAFKNKLQEFITNFRIPHFFLRVANILRMIMNQGLKDFILKALQDLQFDNLSIILSTDVIRYSWEELRIGSIDELANFLNQSPVQRELDYYLEFTTTMTFMLLELSRYITKGFDLRATGKVQNILKSLNNRPISCDANIWTLSIEYLKYRQIDIYRYAELEKHHRNGNKSRYSAINKLILHQQIPYSNITDITKRALAYLINQQTRKCERCLIQVDFSSFNRSSNIMMSSSGVAISDESMNILRIRGICSETSFNDTTHFQHFQHDIIFPIELSSVGMSVLPDVLRMELESSENSEHAHLVLDTLVVCCLLRVLVAFSLRHSKEAINLLIDDLQQQIGHTSDIDNSHRYQNFLGYAYYINGNASNANECFQHSLTQLSNHNAATLHLTNL